MRRSGNYKRGVMVWRTRIKERKEDSRLSLNCPRRTPSSGPKQEVARPPRLHLPSDPLPPLPAAKEQMEGRECPAEEK